MLRLMTPIRIEVAAAAGSYPVLIGANVLATLPSTLDRIAPTSRRIVVSSPAVWDLHHASVLGLTPGIDPLLVPDGERAKNLATVTRVYDGLIQRQADRGSMLIAVGGGVIGDLVGFAAATYLRGVRLIHVPTTLMAQVDSAIGGKVGVNHALGKNLIGAFHAPQLVLSDSRVLATLPRREFRAGLYEVIKYGVIASAPLLDRVERTLPALFERDDAAITEIVAESCRIKARIVGADERESGPRRVLNFGHTIGHALEAVTKYKRFRHGEAVAYGMIAALSLGVTRGVTPPSAKQQVTDLVAKLGPLPPAGDLPVKEIVAAVARDKKVVAGTLHFIAATRIGATIELDDVTEKELRLALQAIGVKAT